MNDTIELPVLAKDYEGTEYLNPCNCAISKAAKRYFKTEDVDESVSSLLVGDIEFHHPDYDYRQFVEDRTRAYRLNCSDDVVRTITLTSKQPSLIS